MLKLTIIVSLLCGITALVEAQEKTYTKFTDTLTVRNKIIYRARMNEIDYESFVYAVCEQPQEGHRQCNVTIQKEAQKRTCQVRFEPVDPDEKYSRIFSYLSFYQLNDEKVSITWSNYMQFVWKATHLKILDISTCELIDVPIPAAQIIYVVVYKNALDLGFRDKNYCGSKNCKITINDKGQLISGPTDILKDIEVAYVDAIAPVNQNTPDQGFYADIGLSSEFGHGEHNNYLYKINGQGESLNFLTLKILEKFARVSASHDLFSYCYTFGEINSTVGCIQYDKTLNLKLNTTLKFEDGKLKRWMQPYNLKNGGLLLITGKTSDVEGKHYDSFSVIKIHQDGQTDEAIEFDHLNFSGAFIGVMYVHVSEKESGDICIYFTSTYKETDDEGQYTNRLQLAIKCLSKT